MIRIPYQKAYELLTEIQIQKGFTKERAELSARLFCEANRDGVLSHGLARFPNLVAALDSGRVIPENQPEKVWTGGAMERWDGKQGPGNLNAYQAMGRALDLADQFGMGTVALSNTNHWMRGGNFGWQAVEAGKIGICWTNTMPNLPPWGSSHPLIGNNPLVMAVPREKGPVVLDMAVSQFSYGALDGYASLGKELPVPGGYDPQGKMSTDPAAILEARRPLPVGFWKGSGLSILLDLTAALLSGGKPTCDIEPDPGAESQICQVFMAFAPPEHPGLADRVVESLRQAGEEVRYPGEKTLERRKESDAQGILAAEATWEKIQKLR